MKSESVDALQVFAWDPSFNTGLPVVDAQHSRLVDLINDFGERILRAQRPSAEEADQVFADLAGYAAQHFGDEEALMTQAGVDPRHVEGHRFEHDRFLDQIEMLRALVRTDNPQGTHALLSFLTHWLAYHILGADRRMARQIALLEKGASAGDAYGSNANPSDPATAALLRALDGLYRHVSDRNRELFELNRTLEVRVAERTRELLEANRRLEEMAMTDFLTGLPNRRQALRVLERQWKDSTSDGGALSCIMIDVDGFKAINDSHGHEAGDQVLLWLARTLGNAMRTDDTLCRLGGDEFLVICARTPLDGALQLAGKLHRAVAGQAVPAGGGQWQGSLSIGVAARGAVMSGVDALLRCADAGVYAAKRGGRDRVCTVLRPG